MHATRKMMCAGLVLFGASLAAQTADRAPTEAKQKAFQSRGASALAAETARGKRGDCVNARDTMQSNACLTREMGITDANYKSYVLALGGLLRLSVDEPAAAADLGRKFDTAEAHWQDYRKSQCDTLYQYFIQGTIRGIAYGNCMQTLQRQHMHDLATIYSDVLQ